MKTKPLIPNKKTARMLDKLMKDSREGKNMVGPFYTAEDMIKALRIERYKKTYLNIIY
ncbi:MAG: hypothetical protein NTZ38_01245 [Candidatus Taylorbacteria bacterium]|nr:hypothetical protein [Candidatus Taylorbacteria bacterium]